MSAAGLDFDEFGAPVTVVTDEVLLASTSEGDVAAGSHGDRLPRKVRHLKTWLPSCHECGNDDACQGLDLCSDCLTAVAS